MTVETFWGERDGHRTVIGWRLHCNDCGRVSPAGRGELRLLLDQMAALGWTKRVVSGQERKDFCPECSTRVSL